MLWSVYHSYGFYYRQRQLVKGGHKEKKTIPPHLVVCSVQETRTDGAEIPLEGVGVSGLLDWSTLVERGIIKFFMGTLRFN